MDPHQDVVSSLWHICSEVQVAELARFLTYQWSRFTGGSGAPIWTLHACNLQPRNFSKTYSALLQPFYVDPRATGNETPSPTQFPAMIWSTNYDRLANLTMWTLFFAGREYAPQCVIDGMNIQDWLLSHYLGAVAALASAIAQADGGSLLERVVIGWDSINEPAEGLIGRSKLSVVDHAQGKMHKGPTTSVLQEFKLGMGLSVTGAEYWIVGALGPSQSGTVDLDPRGVKIWMDEAEDNKWQARWGYRRETSWLAGQCSE